MRILFLCVANSARSQMAEAIAKQTFGEAIVVESAGSEPTQVNPFAIEVLSEIGIDASEQRSKSVDSIDHEGVDIVVTLCSNEVCPIVLGGAKRLHWPYEDPAAASGDEEACREAFRRVRDQLKLKLETFAQELAA